jgi:hypothetical protein
MRILLMIKLQKIEEIKKQRAKTDKPAKSIRVLLRETKNVDAEVYTFAIKCEGKIVQTNKIFGANASVGSFFEL